jgi:hypothetical protein
MLKTSSSIVSPFRERQRGAVLIVAFAAGLTPGRRLPRRA